MVCGLTHREVFSLLHPHRRRQLIEQQTTTYADGCNAAKTFYTRRENHAWTMAHHWRAVTEHPKGARSIQVLTMPLPELVRTLDAHELDHPQP